MGFVFVFFMLKEMAELLPTGAESHQLQDHSLKEKTPHIFGTDPEELVCSEFFCLSSEPN